MCLGCDPDPAREAFNQMHRALLARVGAEDGRLWKQTASPARTGDAYSGRRCFLPFLSDTHSCSEFKQHMNPSVIYQRWHSRGDSSHYTYSHTHTHVHTHPTNAQKPRTHIHSARYILMRLLDHKRTALIFIPHSSNVKLHLANSLILLWHV